METPAFPPDTGFHAEIKHRVLAYFRESGISPRDSPAMYLKTAVLFLWFAASYVLLVFAAATTWQASLLALSLALAMAGIGFCVQHDANHGAYSRRPSVNRLMGATVDLLGGSAYVWRTKHNVAHHTYTNLAGADADIDLGGIGRLSPQQRRFWFHGMQHLYLWAMYGLLATKWHFVSDFLSLARGRIGQSRIPRPGGLVLLELGAGKALFFGWALVLPALYHPWWAVLLGYAGVSFVLGFVLSVVFQLAHCVDEAAFPAPPPPGQRMPISWAEHQVRTTVDFARDSRLLTWYLGGLNFQIEHHLFPRVCHVHYPRIAGIVEEVCARHHVPYAAHATLRGAVASHAGWLRRMGRPEPVACASASSTR